MEIGKDYRPMYCGILDEGFQGPLKKGDGDFRVRVMGGGVGGWLD